MAVAARARARADRRRRASARCRSSGSGGRHLGSETAAGLLAFAYLAYPWTATSAAAAIHPVTFAIPFYLFCIWFLDTNRLVPFTVCAAARDVDRRADGPADRRARHLVRARAGKQRWAGGVIAVGGVAWTVVAIYVVVPAFAGEHSMFFGFYDEVGGSPLGVVRTLFTDPGADRLGAWSERSGRRVPVLARAPAPVPVSCCLPDLPPSRCRSCSRTGSRTSGR